MAYVTVPKDLDRVPNKVILNLTVRQVVCIGIAGAIGAPFYFLTKDVLGTSNAATGMVILMLPVFFFALYEKHGLPLEKILMNMANVKLIRPAKRKYAARGIKVQNDDEPEVCDENYESPEISEQEKETNADVPISDMADLDRTLEPEEASTDESTEHPAEKIVLSFADTPALEKDRIISEEYILKEVSDVLNETFYDGAFEALNEEVSEKASYASNSDQQAAFEANNEAENQAAQETDIAAWTDGDDSFATVSDGSDCIEVPASHEAYLDSLLEGMI